ncbi:sucrase ferredoxin [Rhodococcus sp. Eu-32]|uniref:sucrase ferredoxin n=1 Tax=Rhodococcus sp. Eu-32 TaxID=1017319 RepID=UPI000DF48223|nr:sucrase ferredoxin [Rhodococcus sp. Eu-32]RRQ27495.1 sucrase ferredoxin [Rhodococcus sp. Eu-32]
MTCSEAARSRGDSLAGTASAGRRWFLLEIDGAWGHSAFVNSDRVLAPALGFGIARHVEAAGMRSLAIRRPGRHRGEGRWRWAVVDARVGTESIRWGEVERPEDVLELDVDDPAGTLSTDPIVAVCTHGRHDQCCAVRGRRVLPALMTAHSEITWECSHLGGDRFAGTMVVFPEGLYYGNVDDADAEQIVRLHGEGMVDPRFFRGRCSLSAVAQAAQHHARVTLSDNRIDTLHPVSERQDGSAWTVVLDHDGRHVEVRLEQGLSDPITTTCRATQAGPVRRFDVISMSPIG